MLRSRCLSLFFAFAISCLSQIGLADLNQDIAEVKTKVNNVIHNGATNKALPTQVLALMAGDLNDKQRRDIAAILEDVRKHATVSPKKGVRPAGYGKMGGQDNWRKVFIRAETKKIFDVG